MGYYYILWLVWLSRFKIPGGSEALERWLSSIRIFNVSGISSSGAKKSSDIGEKGNCVFCCHNGSRNGSFFTNLNKVKKGEKVRLLDTSGKEHLYEVAETFIIQPDDNSVKSQPEDEMLTLLTCAEHGSKRYICKCEPLREGAGDEDA